MIALSSGLVIPKQVNPKEESLQDLFLRESISLNRQIQFLFMPQSDCIDA